MRIRTIKPEFYLHEGLFEAERESKLPLRIAFTGLWAAADREGRFKWEPRRLGVSILPYDGIDFSRVLDALATRGFIVKYTSNDAWFGFIPSFKKHQIINNRERPSDLPEPSDFVDVDASTTREARDGHACKAEGKGREGKGKEQADGEFDEFWKEYPKKVGKEDARKKFKAAKAPLAKMIETLKWQKESFDWKKEGGQYIPNPATWLHQQRWDDEKPKGISEGSSKVVTTTASNRPDRFENPMDVQVRLFLNGGQP